MNISPLYLAALAVGALDVDIVSTRQPFIETEDFTSGCVLDAQGRNWVVKVPRNQTAATTLEAEIAFAPQLLEELRAGNLPFDVMRPAGFASVETGGRAVVYPEPFGKMLEFESLTADEARALGRTIASIHSLNEDLIGRSGLPIYTSQQWRERVRVELETAQKETTIPTLLRTRWGEVLDDDSMWDFVPTVVHGDVAADNFLWSNGSISTVLGLGEAHVGDPARDIVPLLNLSDQQWSAFIGAYENTRNVELTQKDFDRITFTSEFAIIRWLLYGVRNGNREIRNDAVQMLGDLTEDLRAQYEYEAPSSTVATGNNWAEPEFATADAENQQPAYDGVTESTFLNHDGERATFNNSAFQPASYGENATNRNGADTVETAVTAPDFIETALTAATAPGTTDSNVAGSGLADSGLADNSQDEPHSSAHPKNL